MLTLCVSLMFGNFFVNYQILIPIFSVLILMLLISSIIIWLQPQNKNEGKYQVLIRTFYKQINCLPNLKLKSLKEELLERKDGKSLCS